MKNNFNFNTENNKNIEVLAPAGNLDILKAVINAGADAVYLGGSMFGARAFAGNFNEKELLEGLEYAHLRGKKIYMTINTLLKEQELKDRLVEYVVPYYEAGLDAVIVQDLGVFKMLKENFPDLAIHASTQMTITGVEGVKILQDMGASRIVTARELDLQEIRNIRKSCNIEIESFVHGALCYCYSGQCLFSSMNGNRSGNRGRCAQPCRLPYTVIDKDRRCNSDGAYALSPKDMCALPILPDVIEAGVNSLKIEGRMKNVTYAAFVTSMYRKYVDLYLEKGKHSYKVSQKDMYDLMDCYNRGSFTTGYYDNKKGIDMMSITRPNHMGTKALEVIDNVNGRVKFKALLDINAQDVFEIDGEHSFSSGESIKKGDIWVVNLPKKHNLFKGKIINRTKNGRITDLVLKEYVNNTSAAKPKVEMSMYIEEGQPVCLTLQSGDAFVTVMGPEAQCAVNMPVDKNKCEALLSELGNTQFIPGGIEVTVNGNVFIPVGQLKALRREGIASLTDEIVNKYHRSYMNNIGNNNSLDNNCLKDKNANNMPALAYLLKSEDGIKDALESYAAIVYIEYNLFENNLESKRIEELICQLLDKDKKPVIALPHIMRGKNDNKLKLLIDNAVTCGIDTFLVRSLEELGVLSKLDRLNNEGNKVKINVITDANLYAFNSSAVIQMKDLCERLGLNLIRVTLPYELTINDMIREEIESLGIETELIVTAQIPLMVSEQCVRKTYNMCNCNNDYIIIKDKQGREYVVRSYCDYCYSIIYDSKTLDISKNMEDIKALNPNVYRTEQLINDLPFYEGHYYIGVE